MAKKDSEACAALVDEYQKHYRVQQHFGKQLFQKLFKPVDNVIQSYVYEKDKEILAFASFYVVDTQMLDPEINKHYKFIRNGYFFHYAIKENQTEINLEQLMQLILHEMKAKGCDVATCLNVCQNKQLIEKLKMDAGDGLLCYHTFNMDWGKDVKPEEIGIVLV